LVVHCAIIPANTIAHHHLRSVDVTVAHTRLVGHITSTWCGFSTSISAHKFSNSVRYQNLHSNRVSKSFDLPSACVSKVPNIDCRSVGNHGNILVSNLVDL